MYWVLIFRFRNSYVLSNWKKPCQNFVKIYLLDYKFQKSNHLKVFTFLFFNFPAWNERPDTLKKNSIKSEFHIPYSIFSTLPLSSAKFRSLATSFSIILIKTFSIRNYCIRRCLVPSTTVTLPNSERGD